MKNTEIDTLLSNSLSRTMAYESFAPEQQLSAVKADLRSLFSSKGPDFLSGQRDRVDSVVGAATAEQLSAMKAYCQRYAVGDLIEEIFADIRN